MASTVYGLAESMKPEINAASYTSNKACTLMASTVYGLAESMKPEIMQHVTIIIKHVRS